MRAARYPAEYAQSSTTDSRLFLDAKTQPEEGTAACSYDLTHQRTLARLHFAATDKYPSKKAIGRLLCLDEARNLKSRLHFIG